MMQLECARPFFTYSDWANAQLLGAAATLQDEALDRRFDMGPGSLRRTLIHIYNGEHVWLRRWQKQRDTAWPSEDEVVGIAVLQQRFEANARERDAFLAALPPGALAAEQVYRDSRGGLFGATLGAMLMQGILHSHHHRAQAVNMVRQVGAGLVELDYMMSVRKMA